MSENYDVIVRPRMGRKTKRCLPRACMRGMQTTIIARSGRNSSNSVLRGRGTNCVRFFVLYIFFSLANVRSTFPLDVFTFTRNGTASIRTYFASRANGFVKNEGRVRAISVQPNDVCRRGPWRPRRKYESDNPSWTRSHRQNRRDDTVPIRMWIFFSYLLTSFLHREVRGITNVTWGAMCRFDLESNLNFERTCCTTYCELSDYFSIQDK